MKKKNILKILIPLTAALAYLIVSNTMLPIKNKSRSSTFDIGDINELLHQCDSLENNQSLNVVDSILIAHNKRFVATFEASKRVTYWVSDGKTGTHTPKGKSCVVELDGNDKLSSWKIQNF